MSFSVLVNHFLVVGGFVLAILILGRVLREHRPPGNTLAWILAIILIPYVGVPLYLLIGGRKMKRLASLKESFEEPASPPVLPQNNTEKLLVSTGCPASRMGNRVRMIPRGEDAHRALFDLIKSAKHSLFIETFILSRDSVGRAVVEALAQKASEGVKVYLLLDAWGSMTARGRFVNPIRKAGGEIGVFLPMIPIRRRWSANLRNHRKIWIADETKAVIGGRNIGQEYFGAENGGAWGDFNVAIEGPAVGDLSRIFASDWNFATGKTLTLTRPLPVDPTAKNGCLQIVASGPDTPANRLYEGMLTSLVECKQRVWFVTPYFVPDETLVQSLSLQAKLGRDVRVIVPKSSNHKIADFARGSYLRELKAAGVRCYGYGPEMIHTKLTLIDDKIAIVGSANLDMRSLLLNYEVAAFCYSEEEILAVSRQILDLLSRSEPLVFDGQKFKDRARVFGEDVSRLFAPLL